METREYSKRLGALSPAQLQAAVSRFDLGELVSASPATGGLFGQNVFLSTTKGEFVLRGCPHNELARSKNLRAGKRERGSGDVHEAIAWQLAKERYFAGVLHEQTTVGAPWPYLVDESRDIFGWQYAILPRLAGVSLADPATRAALSSADRLEIAKALGEALAALQEATWPSAGEYRLLRDDIVPFERGFALWIMDYVRDLLERSRAASARTTGEDVRWCERLLQEASAALHVPFRPTFVHEDYSEGNVTVAYGRTGWAVTGVLDLMTAFVGDGEIDLCRSVAAGIVSQNAALSSAFARAYLERRPPRDGFRERFPVYMLLDRLLIWEYGQRNSVWFDESTCLRDFAERYITWRPGGG